MSDFPSWFLDESLMQKFLSSGGSDLGRDARLEEALEEYSSHATLTDNEKLGYFSAASPIGAERGRWMVRSPEVHYIPLIFQMQDEIITVDPDTLDREHVDLRALSGDEFLEIALGKFIIYDWR